MSTGQKKLPIGPTVERTVAIPEGLVSHYPLSSVLVVVGIGLGVGIVLGSILGGPVLPRPSLGQRTGHAAEEIGRQMLDAIAGILPQSLSKHIAS